MRAGLALGVVAMCLAGVVGAEPDAGRPALEEIEAACDTENPYLVTACYPVPEGGRVSPAIDPGALVVLRDTPTDTQHFRLVPAGEIGAVWGLAYSRPEHAVYAAAFHKRQVAFGPGGRGPSTGLTWMRGRSRCSPPCPTPGSTDTTRKWAVRTTVPCGGWARPAWATST